MASKRRTRVLCAALCVIYFFNNVAFAHQPEINFWSERRKAVDGVQRRPSEPERFQLASLPIPAPQLLAASPTIPPLAAMGDIAPMVRSLSPLYGSIRKISAPPTISKKRIVIYIQDVHRNSEAQNNIEKTIQQLIRDHTAGLIALEGAFEPIDLSVFRNSSHPKAVRTAADYLFSQRDIAGPVHAALTSPGEIPTLIGIDDPSHYNANVRAYRDSRASLARNKSLLQAEAQANEQEKRRIYNPALLAFDRQVRAYEEERTPLGDYARLLSPDAASSPQLKNFRAALSLEKHLDFAEVERERSALLQRLVQSLSQSQVSELLQQSLAYRTGGLNHAGFYGLITRLARADGVPLSAYPAMNSYARYVLLSERLEPEALLNELKTLENGRYRLLTKTPEEKDLIRRSRWFALTGKLLDFSLTPAEWKEYRQLKSETSNLELSSFESFYQEAGDRNRAMAHNLLQAMDDRKTSVGVLVTGGFHSAGILRELEQAGITVIAFAPKITHADPASGSAYLGVFSQEKTPLENLFKGEKLFLAENPMPLEKRNELGLATLAAEAAEGVPMPALGGQSAKVTSTDRLHPEIEAGGYDVRAELTAEKMTALEITRQAPVLTGRPNSAAFLMAQLRFFGKKGKDNALLIGMGGFLIEALVLVYLGSARDFWMVTMTGLFAYSIFHVWLEISLRNQHKSMGKSVPKQPWQDELSVLLHFLIFLPYTSIAFGMRPWIAVLIHAAYDIWQMNRNGREKTITSSDLHTQESEENQLLQQLGFQRDAEDPRRIVYRDDYQIPRLNFELTFVPHGVTPNNKREAFHGQGDDTPGSHLDEDERSRARKMGSRLDNEGWAQSREGAREMWEAFGEEIRQSPKKFAFVRSPALRTEETAGEFVKVAHEHGVEIQFDIEPLSAEINFQDWDGKTLAQLDPKERARGQAYKLGDAFVKAEGGESFLEFLRRIRVLITELNKKYPGRRVIMAGHGSVYKAIKILLQTAPDIDPDVPVNRNISFRRGRPHNMTPRFKAVVFGMGAVARGYLGDILDRSSFSTTFIGLPHERRQVQRLNTDGEYSVRLVPVRPDENPQSRRIKAEALTVNDMNTVPAVDEADVVFVSVLATNYEEIAKTVAQVVEHRITSGPGAARPLNIIVVTNQLETAETLHQEILEYIAEPYRKQADTAVLGVCPAIVDRIIPGQQGEKDQDLVTESIDKGLQVDATRWIGDRTRAQNVRRLKFVTDIADRNRMKVRTINAAHAFVAFLGYGVGHNYIHKAMKDPRIERGVREILMHIFTINKDLWKLDPETETETLIRRFSNPHLLDPITRVARNPLSKLRSEERLIGTAMEMLENGIDSKPMAQAIAAALLYDSPLDREAPGLQEKLKLTEAASPEELVGRATQFLVENCGLDPAQHESFLALIGKVFLRLYERRQLRDEFKKIGVNEKEWDSSVVVLNNFVYRVKVQHPKTMLSPVTASAEALQAFNENRPLSALTPQDETQLRSVFIHLVQEGKLQPTVIVNIKNLFPEATALYIKELIRISAYFNGHVTFYLVVEDDPDEFRNDYPSVFTALQKAHLAMGESFRTHPTIQIADGGLKARNWPTTPLFGFQGLVPFSSDRTYLHETMIRAGVLMLQMPQHGQNTHLMLPSDSIFRFTQLRLLDGRPLAEWTPSDQPVLGVLVPTSPQQLAKKVVAQTHGSPEKVQFLLPKPAKEVFQAERQLFPEGRLWTLPFLTVWHKESLAHLMTELCMGPVDESINLLRLPSDMFHTLFECVLGGNEERWVQSRPAGVSEKAWKDLRSTVAMRLGEHGERIAFMTMPDGSFWDEGHNDFYKARLEHSIRSGGLQHIWKDPGVTIAGADGLAAENVLITGKGILTLQPGITLRNVVIDLGDNGNVRIEAGWTIVNSYIKAPSEFRGDNGFLYGVFSRTEASLLPIHGPFQGGAQTSNITTRESGGVREEILVSIPFGATTETLRGQRFGKKKWTFIELIHNVDVAANQRNLATFRDVILQKLTEHLPVFPLEHSQYEVKSILPTVDNAVQLLREQIKLRQEQYPGQRIWVDIEGTQGAGKSFLAAKLAEALRREGKHPVLIEEDWYHKSREERDELKKQDEKAWKNRRQTWHRWRRYQLDLNMIYHTGTGSPETRTLTELYDRADGSLNHQQTIELHPDSVIIRTGFFLSDAEKYEPLVERGRRLKVYIGIKQDQSLTVKVNRDTWRTQEEIQQLHDEVYTPSFNEYTALFRPAENADVVFAYPDVSNRLNIEFIKPRSEKPPKTHKNLPNSLAFLAARLGLFGEAGKQRAQTLGWMGMALEAVALTTLGFKFQSGPLMVGVLFLFSAIHVFLELQLTAQHQARGEPAQNASLLQSVSGSPVVSLILHFLVFLPYVFIPSGLPLWAPVVVHALYDAWQIHGQTSLIPRTPGAGGLFAPLVRKNPVLGFATAALVESGVAASLALTHWGWSSIALFMGVAILYHAITGVFIADFNAPGGYRVVKLLDLRPSPGSSRWNLSREVLIANLQANLVVLASLLPFLTNPSGADFFDVIFPAAAFHLMGNVFMTSVLPVSAAGNGIRARTYEAFRKMFTQGLNWAQIRMRALREMDMNANPPAPKTYELDKARTIEMVDFIPTDLSAQFHGYALAAQEIMREIGGDVYPSKVEAYHTSLVTPRSFKRQDAVPEGFDEYVAPVLERVLREAGPLTLTSPRFIITQDGTGMIVWQVVGGNVDDLRNRLRAEIPDTEPVPDVIVHTALFRLLPVGNEGKISQQQAEESLRRLTARANSELASRRRIRVPVQKIRYARQLSYYSAESEPIRTIEMSPKTTAPRSAPLYQIPGDTVALPVLWVQVFSGFLVGWGLSILFTPWMSWETSFALAAATSVFYIGVSELIVPAWISFFIAPQGTSRLKPAWLGAYGFSLFESSIYSQITWLFSTMSTAIVMGLVKRWAEMIGAPGQLRFMVAVSLGHILAGAVPWKTWLSEKGISSPPSSMDIAMMADGLLPDYEQAPAGLIPWLKNRLEPIFGEKIYRLWVGPAIEEAAFTGVPLAIGIGLKLAGFDPMTVNSLFISLFALSRIIFTLLHNQGGRAPPALISSLVFLAVLPLVLSNSINIVSISLSLGIAFLIHNRVNAGDVDQILDNVQSGPALKLDIQKVLGSPFVTAGLDPAALKGRQIEVVELSEETHVGEVFKPALDWQKDTSANETRDLIVYIAPVDSSSDSSIAAAIHAVLGSAPQNPNISFVFRSQEPEQKNAPGLSLESVLKSTHSENLSTYEGLNKNIFNKTSAHLAWMKTTERWNPLTSSNGIRVTDATGDLLIPLQNIVAYLLNLTSGTAALIDLDTQIENSRAARTAA